MYNLSIYLSLFKNMKTDYDSELHEFVTQWIIGNFTKNFFDKEIEASEKSY